MRPGNLVGNFPDFQKLSQRNPSALGLGGAEIPKSFVMFPETAELPPEEETIWASMTAGGTRLGWVVALALGWRFAGNSLVPGTGDHHERYTTLMTRPVAAGGAA